MKRKYFEEMSVIAIALDTLDTIAFSGLWDERDYSMWNKSTEQEIYDVLWKYNPHLKKPMAHLWERSKAVYKFMHGE